ncbi:hypothetical protein [Deinococcus multiflagellatus]|uniref:Uncharacterized protein n=1 Tax=Deinococcus multiflagellatus TaxID=1656887 RepID=A0ABW1ZS37_9DEIO
MPVEAREIDAAAQQLQDWLDTHPEGGPDLPGWAQQLFAQGTAAVVRAALLLRLSALVWRLLDTARVRWTPETHDWALGVVLTLYTVDLSCTPLALRLEKRLEQAGVPGDGSALFLEELPEAALVLLTLAHQSGLTVDEAFTEGTLPVWLDLLMAPAPTDRFALVGPPFDQGPVPERHTRLEAWAQPRETPARPFGENAVADDLAHALALGATLALWTKARGQLPNLDVLDLLTAAASVVLSAQSLAARRCAPAGELRALWTELQALHREIGRPRLWAFQPGTVVPVAPNALLDAAHALRRARHVAAGHATAYSRTTDDVLWTMFDDLHERPQPLSARDQVRLTLVARWALVTSPRSQGMALSATLAAAAELGGVDPLWAWPPGVQTTPSPSNTPCTWWS